MCYPNVVTKPQWVKREEFIMRKLRISSAINLHTAPKDDIVEYVKAGLSFHKRIGFDAADFPVKLITLMGDDWETGIDEIKKFSGEIGIRFEVCHLPYGVKIGGTPEEVAPFNENMHLSIEAAKRLGVDHAVLHPNTVTVPLEEFDRAKEYDSVMAHLSPFAEHASKIGLSLAVENMRLVPQHYPVHRYCGDPDELCEIADALGIGVCWDFGHAHICGLTQSEALAYVGSRLKVLHVNDNFAWGDDHLPPFIGKIDWADAMRGLSSIGFKGLLNYEVGAKRVPASVKESLAHYLYDAAEALLALME